MRSFFLRAAPLAILPMAAPLVAQQAKLPIEPGQRVRVEAPTLFEGWRVGQLARVEHDTLFLLVKTSVRYGRQDVPEPVPFSALSRVQLRERRKSHAGKGAWIGALSGGVAGLITGAVASKDVGADDFADPETIIGLFFGVGAVGGGIIGLGVGLAVRTDVWQDVPLRPPTVTARRDGSVGIGLSLMLPF